MKYALISDIQGAIEFVRVEYDLEMAVEGILASELPNEFARQLRAGGTSRTVEVG